MSVDTTPKTAPGETTPPRRRPRRLPGSSAREPRLLQPGRSRMGGRQSRQRSWGLVVLAALLVLGSGLAVAAWGLRAGDRVSVVAVGVSVAKGQIIQRSDLVSASVAGMPETIPLADVDSVVGQSAAVDMVPGQVLTPEMLASEPVPAGGESVVGLALDPTRVPATGLEAGDLIDVVAVPAGEAASADADLDAPEVLAAAAPVYAVSGDATAGGQVLVSVVVEAGDAARIAAYSTQNRVAVVEASPSEVDAREGGS